MRSGRAPPGVPFGATPVLHRVVHAMLDTDPTHDRADRTEQIDIGRTMTLRNKTGDADEGFCIWSHDISRLKSVHLLFKL